ncbi:unnamed protein product, partial [Adineta steineri]
MGNNKSITSIQANAKQVSSFSKGAIANRRLNIQRMQNVLLIWLDNSINENNADCSNTIKQLKRVFNNICIFTDGEQCLEFIRTITNNTVCMIVSGSLGQYIVPHIHTMPQVDTILIFGNKEEWCKSCTKEWPKIRGIFTEIIPICEALKQADDQC